MDSSINFCACIICLIFSLFYLVCRLYIYIAIQHPICSALDAAAFAFGLTSLCFCCLNLSADTSQLVALITELFYKTAITLVICHALCFNKAIYQTLYPVLEKTLNLFLAITSTIAYLSSISCSFAFYTTKFHGFRIAAFALLLFIYVTGVMASLLVAHMVLKLNQSNHYFFIAIIIFRSVTFLIPMIIRPIRLMPRRDIDIDPDWDAVSTFELIGHVVLLLILQWRQRSHREDVVQTSVNLEEGSHSKSPPAEMDDYHSYIQKKDLATSISTTNASLDDECKDDL